MKKLFSGNVTWLLVAGGVIAFWLVFHKAFSSNGFFGRLLSSGSGASTDSQKKDRAQAEAWISALDANPKNFSRTEAELKQIADTQFQAMQGLGTDKTLLFDSLKNCNADDLKQIAKYFGIKEEVFFGWVMYYGDIFGWYQEDLSGADLKKMGTIWSPTGLWPLSN